MFDTVKEQSTLQLQNKFTSYDVKAIIFYQCLQLKDLSIESIFSSLFS